MYVQFVTAYAHNIMLWHEIVACMGLGSHIAILLLVVIVSLIIQVWSVDRGVQLLFIFPTRVSLTTIALYYYSYSVRGLPRLRFYVVPDDFDVWDAPITSYPRVDVAAVPPGGEPVGRRNVSINVNFKLREC